jgi:beta-galactosidase
MKYNYRNMAWKNMKKKIYGKIILFYFFSSFSFLLQAQELYVGANYHPHDNKNPEKIKKDIQLMKEAGFKVVRMGHLAWDSYEPSDGSFDFS